LKTFAENSRILFIIVSIWREEHRLIRLNGDLTNRISSVDVDTWKSETLNQVIDAGIDLLNITFDEDFRRDLLQRSLGSVHLLREACRRVCRMSGLTETHAGRKPRNIGSAVDAAEIISQIVSEQAGRYRSFLMQFANGLQQTDYEMPKWIIYAILCSPVDQLNDGLRLRRITATIRAKHPKRKELNNAHVEQILNSVSLLQTKIGTRPLVLDYDAAKSSLDIVDKAFLIWLATQNIKELMDDLGLPESLDSKVLEAF
jgi:hypothetical protein